MKLTNDQRIYLINCIQLSFQENQVGSRDQLIILFYLLQDFSKMHLGKRPDQKEVLIGDLTEAFNALIKTIKEN